ncbi:hypothetical protein K501DRAFT_197361, partial [Backusella circina FSU 941]
EYINTQVAGYGEQNTIFKLKRKNRFYKLMEFYCERAGIDMSIIRFLYDRTRILPDDMPEMLNMEEFAVVHIMIEQRG